MPATIARLDVGGNLGAELHAAGIIRAFSGNRHVVDVALAQASAGDADELRLLLEFGKISCADIAHRRAQPARKLMHDAPDRALVGHLPLDSLWHQLERVFNIVLKIAVGGAARHRAYRSHSAI